jgi:hypothetical protein
MLACRRIMSDCSDFAESKFHLECGRIEFTGQGSDPISVFGPGYIEQTARGALEYLSYLDGESIRLLLQQSASPRPIGSILRDEDFFRMQAFPVSGGTWVSRVTKPNVTMGFSGLGIARGRLYEIRQVVEYGTDFPCDFATLFIPKLVEFPKNAATETKVFRFGRKAAGGSISRDCAEIKIDEEQVYLYPIESHTEIECCFEKGGIDRNRHIRIQEALEFALGQLLTPCALRLHDGKRETTILRTAGDWDDVDGQELPPLRFGHIPWQPEVYSIAADYYRAVRSYEGDTIHPISFGTYSIINSAKSNIELKVLAVAVAAETLIEAAFPEIAVESDDFISAVKSLRERLETLGIENERLKERLDGALKEMPKPRNSDRLRAFTTKYNIDKGIFKSWQSLRNLSAHGGRIPMSEIEEAIRKLRDVLYLCYSIVLEFVGYRGQRTNYSKPGYPTENYTPLNH